MGKLSGWQKAGLFVGVGCASIVAVLFIGAVVAILWARSAVAEYGDTTPTDVERSITLPTPAAPAAQEPTAGASFDAVDASPLRLTLELQEGRFTVEPGAPGTPVQVQGRFSESLYELTEDEGTQPGGGAYKTIRFRSKAPMWVRMLSGMMGGGGQGQPQLTVRIPEDTPIDLRLQVSMGESRINLGRLTLGEVDVELAMGEHRLDFEEPIAETVRRLRLNTSMGNVSVDHLGNARPQAVEARSSMGNVTLDLGGDWKPGAVSEISVDQSMGELTVRAPRTVRLETTSSTSMGNVSDDSGPGDQPQDDTAPTLRLRSTSSMGEMRVVRY